ncbi:MAG: threonine ammonia-lyase IlvA [bacterium]
MSVSIQSINQASQRLQGVSIKTPLEFNQRLSDKYNAEIYLKREDLQPVRSFKIRGAYNLIASLSEQEKSQGVVCASAGNHAQGVAYSCSKLGIKGVIFMPVVTPNQKIEKVKKFGADFVEVVLVGDTFDEASLESKNYCQKNNMVYVHPFDDDRTIAGQGTVAKEIFEEISPDIIVSCVGGGGLISGVASFAKEFNPQTLIYGVEPFGAAGMYEALKAGKLVTLDKIDTFVDGAAVRTVGQKTLDITKQKVEKVVLVPEGEVCFNMVELYQNEGIIAEPAGTLAVSGLDQLKNEIIGKKVICIISGGNNDISRYPEIIERSLVWQGKKHYFIIEFTQKPGQLRKFVVDVLGPTDDISRFEYIKKTNKEKGAALVGVELSDKNNLPPLLERFEKSGLDYKKIETGDLIYQQLI